MTFGKGKSLRQQLDALRDPQRRKEIILDRVHRDSVIEGLPWDQQIEEACGKAIDRMQTKL